MGYLSMFRNLKKKEKKKVQFLESFERDCILFLTVDKIKRHILELPQ